MEILLFAIVVLVGLAIFDLIVGVSNDVDSDEGAGSKIRRTARDIDGDFDGAGFGVNHGTDVPDAARELGIGTGLES